MVLNNPIPAVAAITQTTPARVLGTTYQNGANARFICASVSGTVANNAVEMRLESGPTSTPTDPVARWVVWESVGSSEGWQSTLSGWIPPLYYYRVRQLSGLGTGALTGVVEWDLANV